MVKLPLKKGLFHIPNSGDDKPYLLGSRCRVCGYTCFPKKSVCISCLRDGTMEEIKLGRYGNLENFAVMQVGTYDFPAPYIIGYVRTKEGAIVFTPITGCQAKNDVLQIGEEMELIIEEIKNDQHGNRLLGWKYKPMRKKMQ